MQSFTQQPDDLRLREALAVRLNSLIADKGLSQHEAGTKIGMTQSKVSQIHRLQLKNISVSKLLYALVALEQQVEIIVRPSPHRASASVRVCA